MAIAAISAAANHVGSPLRSRGFCYAPAPISENKRPTFFYCIIGMISCQLLCPRRARAESPANGAAPWLKSAAAHTSQANAAMDCRVALGLLDTAGNRQARIGRKHKPRAWNEGPSSSGPKFWRSQNFGATPPQAKLPAPSH